jgi:alkylation response protein AidB-like acyl-CoA dehydrogenase
VLPCSTRPVGWHCCDAEYAGRQAARQADQASAAQLRSDRGRVSGLEVEGISMSANLSINPEVALPQENLAGDVPSLDDNATSRQRVRRALRHIVFGDDYDEQLRVRDAIIALNDIPESHTTYAEQARKGYELLRAIVGRLGGSSRRLAADHQQLAAVFDWSAVFAPRLLPILSGHFNLTIGAIERLGTGTEYQRQCLDELDTTAAVGVMLLTELGYGTNVLDQQTRAVWHPNGRYFTLSTPSGDACKWMPNVADPDVAKTTIVTARLIVDGADEGVFPFLVRLRTKEGLAHGVDVVPLPDKGYAPMDNAMIRFNDVVIPEDALLCGEFARINEDGSFTCDLDLRERFHRSIGQLQSGRINLAAATVASARASLALTLRYAQQRLTSGNVLMSARDGVLRDLISSMSRIYAVTAFANDVQTRFANADADPSDRALHAMLAKPLLSYTAHDVLQTCRQRLGAQGMFRDNLITDYIGSAQGVITAEGENQSLQVATGRILRRIDPSLLQIAGKLVLQIAGKPDESQWWITMLCERESIIAAAGRQGKHTGVGAIGPDSFAIVLASATAERLAAQSLAAAAVLDPDPDARAVIENLTAVYALERVLANAGWYTAAGLLTSERAAQAEAELTTCYTALIPHLPTLADAFDIPDLNAPINNDYISAWLEFAGWHNSIGKYPGAAPQFGSGPGDLSGEERESA